MPEFRKVAAAAEVPPGTGKMVEIGEFAVALFNVAGTFYAIDNTCPHRNGPLGEGYLNGSVVSCPWHGWTFDVRTGRFTEAPDVSVPSYPVRLDGPDVYVEF